MCGQCAPAGVHDRLLSRSDLTDCYYPLMRETGPKFIWQTIWVIWSLRTVHVLLFIQCKPFWQSRMVSMQARHWLDFSGYIVCTCPHTFVVNLLNVKTGHCWSLTSHSKLLRLDTRLYQPFSPDNHIGHQVPSIVNGFVCLH